MYGKGFCKKCNRMRLGKETSAGFLCDCGHLNLQYDLVISTDGSGEEVRYYCDNCKKNTVHIQEGTSLSCSECRQEKKVENQI